MPRCVCAACPHKALHLRVIVVMRSRLQANKYGAAQAQTRQCSPALRWCSCPPSARALLRATPPPQIIPGGADEKTDGLAVVNSSGIILAGATCCSATLARPARARACLNLMQAPGFSPQGLPRPLSFSVCLPPCPPLVGAVNRAMLLKLGYTKSELEGKNVSIIV